MPAPMLHERPVFPLRGNRPSVASPIVGRRPLLRRQRQRCPSAERIPVASFIHPASSSFVIKPHGMPFNQYSFSEDRHLGISERVICRCPGGFRFTLESRHSSRGSACLKSARLGHQRRYSITSSALASRDGGTARPRAFAVTRLIVRSNFVGCSTGRSAGLAPRKTLST